MSVPRPAAVLGGNRIPFARSNGPYRHASNHAPIALNDDLRRVLLSANAVTSPGEVARVLTRLRPGSSGVNGQVVRVCGQMILGA